MTATKQLSALVTGANGFLGKHLCELLVKNDWQVYALCRSQAKALEINLPVKIIIGDINQTADFQAQLPENLDALFNTAASTNTWFKNNALQMKTNIEGSKNLVQLAKEKNIRRFIHTSSVVAYGLHNEMINITEDMPKAGINSWINYVKTKAISEQIILDAENVDSVVLNPTHIIGPGDKYNWARLIQMIAKQKLPSIPNGAGSFVDVRDVAFGLLAAYHHGKPKHNYLLGGHDMSFKQFVHEIANQLQLKVTKTQLPTTVLMLLARIKNLVSRFTNKEPDITPESVALISDLYRCDSAHAKKELNYKITNFTTTIKDTLNDLKQEGII